MTQLHKYAGPYIPRKHEKFRRWAFVFTAKIAKDPQAVGLTEAIALELGAAFAEFNEAYRVAVAPSTRTRITVGRMNAARKVLERLCRTYAQRIKNNDEVPDETKWALHLHLGRKPRREIGAPQSRPMLLIPQTGPGRHVLRWWDDSMGIANRKPKDAAALQLFAVVAERIVSNPEAARYVGTYTRQPIRLNWGQETAGKTITYFGRWITNNGKEGPWSLPRPMQMAFGGAMLETIERVRGSMNVESGCHASSA